MSKACLNLHMKDNSKLPQAVIDSVINDKTALLENHIKELEKTAASYKEQHTKAKAIAADTAIKASLAYSYTNRTDDTNNELNQFEPVGLSKLLKNIVQRVGSVTNALKSSLLRENGIADEEIASIKYFNDTFNKPFQQAVERVFEPKGALKVRFLDMLKYLPFRNPENTAEPASVTYDSTTYTSKLDVPTKTAMAATIYEWLHTNGNKATGHTPQSLREVMNYEKDEVMPTGITTHFTDLGVNTELLAKQLGSKILQRMAIKPTEAADMDAKLRLELSLGFMAIATMENMIAPDGKPYFERQEVYTGVEDNGLGIKALKENATLTADKVFHPQTPEQRILDIAGAKKGKTTASFTKLRSTEKYTTPAHMKAAEEHMRNAPHAFDKLFDNESDEPTFSLNKIKLPTNAKIGRDGTVGAKQTANLQKSVDVTFGPAQTTMEIFEALGEGKAFEDTIGMVDDTNLLLIRKKSVEGTNRGVQRDLNNLRQYMKLHRIQQAKGESSLFYIGAKFMNNMRMLMQGDINPQNSKMHRNLFSPTSWLTEFNPATDTETNEAFLQSIALAFGIESGKVGGAKIQLEKLDKLMQKDVFVNAVKSIQDYYAMPEGKRAFTDAQQTAVAAAVKEGGEKLHSLKGLVEYARYEAHRASDGLFSTDMYNEIDGVSNGPIIGILMLIPDSADKQAVLASLAMGGLSVDRNKTAPNLDELLSRYNLNDAYQRMSEEWVNQIAELKKQLKQDSTNSNIKPYLQERSLKNYNYSIALETLLGRFTETKEEDGTISNEGIVNKLIRKLSKPRTMQTTYGAGIYRQNLVMSGENVISEGIYGGIEKVLEGIANGKAEDINKADFRKILKSVAMLTDQVNHNKLKESSTISLAKYTVDGSADGKLDHKKIRGEIAEDGTVIHKGFQLSADDIGKINDATSYTYGKAMEKAIDIVYASVIEARQPFNTLIQRQATIYNLVLKSKVEAQRKLNNAKTTDAFGYQKPQDKDRLTVAELNVILKDIEFLRPKMKTPYHVEGDTANEGYISLAEVGRQTDDQGNRTKDYSDETAMVEQNYTKESGISKLKGNVDSIPYLKTVGPSAIVRSIQMLDSTVANHLMSLEGIDIVNAHDGFIHSFKDSEAIRDAANQRFFDVMSTYSLGQSMYEMHTATEAIASLESIIDDNNIDKAELVKALIKDRVVNFEVYGVSKRGVEIEVEARQDEARKAGNKLTSKQAKQAFLTELSGFHDNNTEEENQVALDRLFGLVTENAKSMAEQVTRNKQEVTSNITQSAQYPHNGIGVTIAPTATSARMFTNDKVTGNIDPDTVLTMVAAKSDAKRARMIELRQEGFFASSADNVSTEEADFMGPVRDRPDTENIDSQNVLDKFDSIITLDNQAAHASVQNSPEHIADLRRILSDIVARVMTPVSVFIAEHKSLQEDTRGLYKLGDNGNKIYIQRQNRSSSPAPGMLTQGIRMSAAEVYAHEMIHHITHFGLKNNNNLRQQTSKLFDITYKEFTKAYGDNAFKVFMNDPNADLNDPANAHEIIAAKERWEYVFNSEQRADGSYAALDEFLTHGMTNENFKRELDKLTIDHATLKNNEAILGIFEKNIQTTIVNLFTRIMDFVQTTFRNQQHSSNVAQELENLVKALSLIENKQAGVLFQAAANGEAKLAAFGVKMDDKVKEFANKQMNKTAIGKMITDLKKFPELDNFLSHQMRLTMLWYNDKEQGLLQSIATEMTGTTERFRPLYDLLSKRKIVIDQAKNDVAQVMRDTLNDLFKRTLESQEKAAITKVLLKGDISSLLDKSSLTAIQGFIDNKDKRQTHIDGLLAQIKTTITPIVTNKAELAEYMTFFEGGITDLAYGMITSESFKEGVNYRNAHNLALMSNTGYDGKLIGSVFNHVVDLLDQAASVKSIDYMRSADKATISSLMSEDMSAIEDVLKSHNVLKQQTLTDLFYDNPTLMEKGYTKTILNGRIQMEFGTLADEQRFADQGYTRNGEIPRDPQDPVRDTIYVYTNVGGGTINDLQEGIVSFTANKTKGANSYDIELQIGNDINPAVTADVNNKRVLAVLDDKVKNMLTSTTRTSGIELGESYMTPKFNAVGKMTSMRYIMSEFAKDTYLQQFSEFDSVLAAMASTRVDKLNTPEINKDVVVALKEMWDKDRVNYAGGFVSISPYSEHKRHRDIYNMFTPKMKQHILSEWGNNEMLVPQEMVDLVFGQRKYSILEMFGKTKEERNIAETLIVEGMQFALGFMNPFVDSDKQVQSVLGRTANRAKSIEDFLTQLTKLAKGNIVVRNFFVTWGNHVSNVMYLKSKGTPLKSIIPLQREAIDSALRYQADNSKLQVLINKRDIIKDKQSLSVADRNIMVTNLTREIKRLENEIAINPSTAMIAAGLLPSIVDDVDTGHIQSPYKFGLNKAIDDGLGKLHPMAEKVGRTIFMTEDTESYRMLNNAVKMTDYVGRYVLYKHYTKGGMEHKDAVSAVAAEFIDFAPPTHRMIEYANNIGLVWFSKYQLRVLKHIKNVVTDHPFSTLATFIIGQQLGNQNILNSIPGVTKGMLSFMGNPLAALMSGGPEILYVNGLETVGSMLTGD